MTLVFGDGEGGRVSFACDPQVEARAWYRVVATFDAATGDATLRLDPTNESVSSHLLPGTSQARGDHKRFRVPFPPAVAAVPFRIGAGSTGNAGFPEGVGHFNGKIGNPRVSPTAHVAHGASPLAEWDFARSNRSDRALLDDVVDVSGGGFHAVCTNSPTRAVTGSNWTGREPNFRHAPGEYGAIHFHDDDLDDAQWPEAFGVDLPAGLASGVYAIRLRDGRDREPRAVRRPARTAQQAQRRGDAAPDRLVPRLRQRPAPVRRPGRRAPDGAHAGGVAARPRAAAALRLRRVELRGALRRLRRALLVAPQADHHHRPALPRVDGPELASGSSPPTSASSTGSTRRRSASTSSPTRTWIARASNCSRRTAWC